MSGPFGSSQWMYASGGFYPYEIEQSLRFNDDDSAYLSRTPASAGNRKTWTWSGWVKWGDLGATATLLGTTDDNTSAGTSDRFRHLNDGRLEFTDYTSAYRIQLISTARFRDPSAWYHLVLAVDTTQATTSNRVKLYVNGVQITAFDTANYPSLNHDTYINNAEPNYIGAFNNSVTGVAQLFDGYMAEVNFIDGLALDPTSFGEFKSDIWVPKEYSGSYGTNGFYLSFADSANIGDDLSGNTNDWTANNLVSTDVLLDSPTNNYAVGNVLAKGGNLTAQEGNLEYTNSSSTNSAVPSTIGVTSGKWYVEYLVKTPSTGSNNRIGVSSITYTAGSTSENQSMATSGITMLIDGGTGSTWRIFQDGSETEIVSGFANGDVVGLAFDADAKTLAFYLNGVEQGTSSPYSVTDASDGIFYFMAAERNSDIGIFNFGQDSSFAGNKTAQGNTDGNGQGDFYYAPPAGYLALNTANLPDPTIDPAVDDVPADYFTTVLTTGDGTNATISGFGFQPDFLWHKSRSTANNHQLMDLIRVDGSGNPTNLVSNLTNADGTSGAITFTSDGYTHLNGSSNNFYGSGVTYVDWAWKAGNGTSSNTSGSITSTVSVNQKAGFSIVSYTGNGTSGATVGHGLGSAPDMIIVKNRTDGTQNWRVQHSSLGPTQGLSLNATDAAAAAVYWNSTAPTSSVFSVDGSAKVNASGDDYIAYCFAEVEGFSKFGSYTGNGSTDGPFVYCGFRPAWLMVKRTDTTTDWVLWDAVRDANNVMSRELQPDKPDAEVTSGDDLDFTSNGFKARRNANNFNASGGTYIFMAFAEQPVKYSLAR